MKCELCGNPLETSRQNDRLCEKCDNARLMAASAARIWEGTGLTYSNSEKFSTENWIKMHREDE
jgi:hypothetical protein